MKKQLSAYAFWTLSVMALPALFFVVRLTMGVTAHWFETQGFSEVISYGLAGSITGLIIGGFGGLVLKTFTALRKPKN